MSFTIEELHWAAGFLEGEGCFSARFYKRQNSYNPLIDATQVNTEPLDRLQKLFGGGRFYLVKQTGNRQQAYSWRLNGKGAIGVMMTLWSLMSQRRRAQIEIAVAHWKSNEGINSKRYQESRRRGVENGNAKLSEQGVREIRASDLSNAELAKKYHVCVATIFNVKRRIRYSSVA